MITNEAHSSVLLLERHLIWCLDCRSLLNFVCVEEAGDPHIRNIMGTKALVFNNHAVTLT